MVVLLSSASLRAQVDLTVNPEDIGLGGYVRPGGWTPIRFRLDYSGSSPLPVVCQWEFADADGERVQSTREVTLTPQRRQVVTVYAFAPVGTDDKTVWRLEVIDPAAGRRLASKQVSPIRLIGENDRAIGITGRAKIGLQPFESPRTQHEATTLIQLLDPGTFPDRWYGFSLIETLIWTADSVDPGSPTIMPEMHNALREWVRRGGHLVISPPATGDLWTSSPLRDLLPPAEWITRTDVTPVHWLGDGIPEGMRLDMKVFKPRGKVDVLAWERPVLPQRLSQNVGMPTIIAKQYGLGRVTLLGVDLTDPRVTRHGMPAGKFNIWNTLLGFRGPCVPPAVLDEWNQKDQTPPLGTRHPYGLDNQVIDPQINMEEAVSTPLMIAIVTFAAYWLVAGPITFLALKQRNMLRHSWVAFLAVVAGFTAIAWAGGMLLRPSGQRVRHMTVIDHDAVSGLSHTHAWLSLFVPRFGAVDVSLAAGKEQDAASRRPAMHDTIFAPGLPEAKPSSFLDPQRYKLNSLSPDRVAFPFRSTAKQIEIDTLLPPRDNAGSLSPWTMPQGSFTIGPDRWPVGRASHTLPGTLRDVLVVCNLGDGQQPWVWFAGDWAPGSVLQLSGPAPGAKRLVLTPVRDELPYTGFLADRIEQKAGQAPTPDNPQQARPDRFKQVPVIELLTFYNTLPPPRYFVRDGGATIAELNKPSGFRRASARVMDLTRLVGLKGMIIMGHLDNSPLLAPLKVDGDFPSSSGWTVVRWIVPLDEDAAGPASQEPGDATN